jgi:ketosteroid isomerase-like protein
MRDQTLARIVHTLPAAAPAAPALPRPLPPILLLLALLAAPSTPALAGGRAPDPSPAAASAIAAAEAKRVEATIREALDQWVRAYNSRDTAGVMAVWAPDLLGWYPGTPDINYGDTRAGFEREFAGHEFRSTYSLVVEEVQVSGDLAVVRDRWTETDTRPGSQEVTTTRLKSFELWRRQPDGTWKISRWISAPEPRQP